MAERETDTQTPETVAEEPPIQIEGGRDDGRSEITPPVVADRAEQSRIDYSGWDEVAAREQENLPEDEQQA